jgi:branched-chain amino acid transport system ATP-binding protein
MLTVEDLVAGYGNLQILNGISLEAKPGEVTVIVGPNGSGKSTLLKSISGLATIFTGKIGFDGQELTRRHPHDVAKIGLAYLPQTENVFTHLSVSENLRLAAYTVESENVKVRSKEIFDVFPQLSHYLNAKAMNLSGGERQMLAMGMALIRKPSVLMFDEPTANLSPKLAASVLATIRALANMRLTILLVEQNARRALEMGDKAYLLVNGKKNFEGSAKDLLEHKEIGRLYLGIKSV